MKQIIQQCVGIDISKCEFTVCFATKNIDSEVVISSAEEFENTPSGFNRFVKWAQNRGNKELDTLYLMEATGIYYEPLAYHLNKINKTVSVCLPNKVKYFAKSYNIKTKTDTVDARLIASFGVERKHTTWAPPQEVFRILREIIRLRAELVKYKTATLNRKEALEHGAIVSSVAMKVVKSALSTTEKQIEECERYIKQIVTEDVELKAKVDRLCTIKGVGFMTVVTIIAETQGFELITSRKQLASYAGYDVVERQSGSSVKGKTCMSKKGNSHIRGAMFLPALSAARHNPQMREHYERVKSRRNQKMVGMVAVQRKLLLLIFTLWKNGQTFRAKEEEGDIFSSSDKAPSNIKKVGNPSIELPTQDKLSVKKTEKSSFVLQS